jgi:hypothetical protein
MMSFVETVASECVPALLVVCALLVSFVGCFLSAKVPEHRVCIVERNGRFERVLGPGLHYVNTWTCQLHSYPGLYAIRAQEWWDGELLVPTDPQRMVIPTVEGLTSDGVRVSIDATVHFSIDVDLRQPTKEPNVPDGLDLVLVVGESLRVAVQRALANEEVARVRCWGPEAAKSIAGAMDGMLRRQGIHCLRVFLNKIELDRAFVRQEEAAAKELRTAELRVKMDRLAHEQRLVAMDLERVESEKDHEEELRAARRRAELRVAEGLSVDEEVRLERTYAIKNLVNAMSGTKAPSMSVSGLLERELADERAVVRATTAS